jgi:hypothetical protein
MDKETLLKQCKELGIKGVSKLNKAELLEKIKESQQPKEIKTPLPNYLFELHKKNQQPFYWLSLS